MKAALILAVSISFCAMAQDAPTQQFHIQIADGGPQVGGNFAYVSAGAFGKFSSTPVQGAPYSATMTNESIQTLADGNRIVQTTTGTMARDSLGRTRQDAPLPAIGDISPAKAPHLVFIQDPVAQTSYTLDLTDKTAMKGPSMPPPGAAGVAGGMTRMVVRTGGPVPAGAQPRVFELQKTLSAVSAKNEGETATEDLGSQVMEGVQVTGTRTTRTIPAGQIGNDKAISIVTEVWTSPELKTVVYSKRTDPRMGEQTFKLTNIQRTEPDSTLFTVPADFKVIDGAEPIIYHANQ